MTDHDLRHSLAAHQIPGPSAQARERALHRATIALANSTHTTSTDTRRRSLGIGFALSTLTATAAIILCAWFALRPAPVQTATATTSPTGGDLLAKTGLLFPGQLNAIVIQDGETRLDLSPTATLPAPDDQAVLVELTRNGHTLRVLGYSGRSVSIEFDGTELRFVPLLTATGDILLSGDNFIWSKAEPAKIAGWNVSTQTLEVRL